MRTSARPLLACVAVCLALLLHAPTASAAPGELGQACLAGDGCNSGLSCVDLDAGAPVTKLCTRTCTDTGPLSRECSAPTSCVEVPGVGNYCVDLTGATVDPDWLRGGTAPSSETVPSETGTNTNVPFTPAVPEPAVFIPGYTAFSTIRIEGEGTNRYVDIPYIAEYIVVVYRYALGIMVTLAMVMIVIGGLQWMTAAGNSGIIQTAKTRITNAVMGLLIAFGSYTILYAINPELVNFRAIRVNIVQGVNIDTVLLNTDEVTGQTDDEREEEAEAAAELEAESRGSAFGPILIRLAARLRTGWETLVAGTVSNAIAQSRSERVSPPAPSGCDLSLEYPYDETPPRPVRTDAPVVQRSRRTVQFMEEISPTLTGSVRDKITKAADTARKCVVHMGSCGATVQTINQLAGVPGLGTTAHSANGDQVRFMIEKVDECEPLSGRAKSRCNVAARRDVFERLVREERNYPAVWIDDLQPGDALYIFNVNGSAGGQHSLVFMGWSGQEMLVVEGGRSSSGAWVRTSTICIRGLRECRFNVYPVTRVFRPE